MLSPVRIVSRSSRAAASAVTTRTPFAACRNVHGYQLQNALRPKLPSKLPPELPTKPWRKPLGKQWIKSRQKIPPDAKFIVCDHEALRGGPITVAWTNCLIYVEDKNNPDSGCHRLNPSTLRDSCTCTRCRDPSSGQKTFASTQIPIEIGVADVRATDEGLSISLTNDMEMPDGEAHDILLGWDGVELALRRTVAAAKMQLPRPRSVLRRTGVQYWDRRVLEQQVRSIDYEDYMRGGEAFWDVVIDLCRLGIVYLKNVPRDEDAVLRITTRIANVRETLYGRAFDVRAKPDAENVAYTSGYLGLHQDLLYLDPPPMIQVLHCMDNSCAGGESLFSDGERVGRLLWPFVVGRRKMAPLVEHFVPYQYTKNGHHYFNSRSILTPTTTGNLLGVCWSPLFQGSYHSPTKDLRAWIEPASIFEGLINAEDAVYRRKMQPGECVLFNNMRVMHGRTAFDAAGGGSRWLRGAYIAGEDFWSRAAHIPVEQSEAYRGEEIWSTERAQRELKETEWHRDVAERVRKIDPGLPEGM